MHHQKNDVMNNGSKKGTRTYQVLIAMNIVAWLAFTGFMIDASGFLVSYCVGSVNPEFAKKCTTGSFCSPSGNTACCITR